MSKKTDAKSEEIEKLNLLAADFEEKWTRAIADYQNLDKRSKEEKEKLAKYAAESLIVKLLPALDHLEKARQHLNDAGLDLAVRQLYQVLGQEGLEKIKTVGENFNPQEMEAIDAVEGENENKVTREFRPGYKLSGKVIRVAQVQVEKKNVEQKAEDKAPGEL